MRRLPSPFDSRLAHSGLRLVWSDYATTRNESPRRLEPHLNLSKNGKSRSSNSAICGARPVATAKTEPSGPVKRPQNRSVLLRLAGQKGEFLVGLLGNRRVRIVGFDLPVELGRFRRVFLVVVFGEGEHDNRLRDEHRWLRDQLPIQLDGFVGFAGAVIELGESKPRHRGELFVATAGESSKQFFRVIVLVKLFETQRLEVACETARLSPRKLGRAIGEFLGRFVELHSLILVGEFARLWSLPRG